MSRSTCMARSVISSWPWLMAGASASRPSRFSEAIFERSSATRAIGAVSLQIRLSFRPVVEGEVTPRAQF